MANAAASHVAEQDDVHNGSVFHPATVVFPPALAVAQALGASGRELLTAVVAGYEVGIRVGEFLGRSHYKVFHTTGTAGTLAAAAAVGRLLGLDAGRRCSTPSARPARSRRACGSSCATPPTRKQLHTRARRGGRPDGRLPGARRLHRRAPHPRRAAGHGGRHVDGRRSGPARSTAWARAGRWPRPRSSSTRRAATRIRRPTRCCR